MGTEQHKLNKTVTAEPYQEAFRRGTE